MAALHRDDVPGGSNENFERITRLAKRLTGAPIATVSIVEGQRLWFAPTDGLAEAPGMASFLAETLAGSGALVLRDASLDPRFAKNALVTEAPKIRAYAGVPLRTRAGEDIGVLAAIDVRPHEFSPADVEILADLGGLLTDEFELRARAPHDPLTDALSREAFGNAVIQAIALALRHHNDVSCVALKLDQFAAFSQGGGRGAGDRLLVEAVQACRRRLRKTDLLGRIGADEFAVLLPHASLAGAKGVADKLRVALGKLTPSFAGEQAKLTASFGIVSLSGGARSAGALMEEAEAAMFEAASAGGDRIVLRQGKGDVPADQARRRVLKGGFIVFHDGASSIECTVRTLSEQGAGIDVYSTIGVPRTFTLAIRADRFEKRCRIVSQSEKHLEVEFVGD